MNCRYLLAAGLMIASAAPLSAQSVKAGIDAWQKSDYAGAVAIWRPLAEKGDADAEFNLGQAYRLGRGVPTDLAAAKTWFERAAGQGHVDGETTLGLLLFQNGDQAGGVKWLKKAAEQGDPRASLVYGTALVNGDGVSQDPVLGYAYVSRAAADGLGPAKDTLGQLDQILSAADRKRGAAMARELAKAPPAAKLATVEKKATEVAAAKAPVEKPTEVATAAPAPKAPAQAAPKTAANPPAPVSKPKAESEAKPPAQPAPKPVAASTSAVAKPGSARPAPSAAKGGWRIQLGAFSHKGSAEALYGKLAGKAALAGRQPFYIPVGAITRLQVGPFESKAAAQSACSALGVPCFPVAAK